MSAQREGHDTAPGMLDPQVPLAAGSRAPHFTLHDGAHSTMGLTDLLGRAAVLVFYVADWHPVASDQLVQLTALYPEVERLGASVVGIAADSPWSHAAFAADKSITFPLLSDDAPAGQVARAFGVYSSAYRPKRAGSVRPGSLGDGGLERNVSGHRKPWRGRRPERA